MQISRYLHRVISYAVGDSALYSIVCQMDKKYVKSIFGLPKGRVEKLGNQGSFGRGVKKKRVFKLHDIVLARRRVDTIPS